MKTLIKKIWNNKFIRFVLIGGVNTVFGYSAYAFFIYLGINYQIAIPLSTICGILFNFKTTGSIVFENKNNKLFLKFLAVYGFIYLVNINLYKLLLVRIGDRPYAIQALLLPVIVVLSFMLNKFLVFKDVYKKDNLQKPPG